MLEILGEDRERIEELHREIKKEQERIAIRSLIATQKALMMLEGMSLQVTLGGQSEKMRSFATTTLVSDLRWIYRRSSGRGRNSTESSEEAYFIESD